MIGRSVSAIAIGVICSLASMQAQSPGASARLSAATRAAALETIAAAFQEMYVVPELRPAIVERLNQAQRSGRYDLDDPVVFAERITEDLLDVSHDKHLSLTVNPAAYAAALAPSRTDAGEEAFTRRQAIRHHHGLTEMKLLPGNLRYLKIAGFEWVPDVTGAVYDQAMRFLKDGDALIIDLRGNGGGWHFAVQYLVSHFLDEDTLELTFLEGSGTPVQSRTLAYLPAGRLKGKPLYVLIDGGVGSAAEAFAYDVQQFNLGELIGARTAGAANNNKLLPIAPAFMLSVSYGRPVHAVSQSNWEGAGIAPTVAAAPAQALDVAQLLALQRLTETPGIAPERRAEYAWAQIGVEARLHPVTLAPDRLKALAGHYGELTVELRDEALWLVRPNSPTARLSPLTSEGLFAVDGAELLRVRLPGNALELHAAGTASPRVFSRR